MIRFFRRPGRNTTDPSNVDEARAALESAQQRGEEVDALVIDLRARRRQNHFAPSIEAAFQAARTTDGRG